jgi:hypothetical protein
MWFRKKETPDAGYEKRLLSYMSQFDIHYFLDTYFSLNVDGFASKRLDYDGFVFYGDRILKIVSENQSVLVGTRKNGFNLKALLEIMRDSQSDAKESDQVRYLQEMDEPFNLMGKTFYSRQLLRVESKNKRYLGRLPVSVSHFELWARMLDNRTAILKQQVGVTPDVFVHFLVGLVLLSHQGTSRSVELEDLSEGISRNEFETCLRIVERHWLPGYFKIYEVGKKLYAVNFEIFEQEAFYLYVDYLRTVNPNLADNIMKDRGRYLENEIVNVLSTLIPRDMIYQNVFINDQETDVCVPFGGLCFVVEAKSTKYDSEMLETGQNNNCKKEISKATKQLSKVKSSLESPPWSMSSKINGRKDFNKRRFTIVPLIITFDDYYDVGNQTANEATKKDYAFNPLVLSLDEFSGIIERIRDPIELFSFVLQTTIAKEKDATHSLDNYFDFVVFRNGDDGLPTYHGIVNSFLVRQDAYIDSLNVILDPSRSEPKGFGSFTCDDVKNIVLSIINKFPESLSFLALFYNRLIQCQSVGNLFSEFGFVFQDKRLFFTKQMPANLNPNGYYILLSKSNDPIQYFKPESTKA